MNEQELDAIRKRVEAASTGPWTYEAGGYSGDNWLIATLGTDAEDGLDYYVTTDHVHASEMYGTARGDAVFISAARQDIPALLAEVDRLRELLAAAEQEA